MSIFTVRHDDYICPAFYRLILAAMLILPSSPHTDAKDTLAQTINHLPKGFVYISDIAPSIDQDLRYATKNNFTGAVVPGYFANECILRRQAARALARVQAYLEPQGLGLRIYDCYRPVTAVRAFAKWARRSANTKEKQRYYPRLDKRQLIRNGYIATRSSHSKGNTVDLTLIRLDESAHVPPADTSFPAAPLSRYTGKIILPAHAHQDDDSLPMGTAFDCFDILTHTQNHHIRGEARANRRFLVRVMRKFGFANYPTEWWHFTYRERATPRKHYNFPIHAKPHE